MMSICTVPEVSEASVECCVRVGRGSQLGKVMREEASLLACLKESLTLAEVGGYAVSDMARVNVRALQTRLANPLAVAKRS